MAETEPPPPAPASSSAALTTDSTGLPRHLAAALAVFFPILGGFVFLTLEKKDPFVRFYAMLSIYLGGALLAGALACGLSEFIFRQIPLIGWLIAFAIAVVNLLFSLAWLGVWLVALFKAFTGKEWEMPVLGKLARQRLASTPA